MLKNYFKIAFRNIFKQKGYSFINITGLSIGMTVCIFLLLWVQDELSFDRFHKDIKNIYRIEQDQKTAQGIYHVTVTPYPLAPALKEEIPEIEESTRSIGMGAQLFRYGENYFYESGIKIVDPSFLRIFSFPLLKGNVENVLNEPFSTVITEEISKKYFANENPVGKVLVLNNKYSVTVTGVLKNIPKNSSMQLDILMPYAIMPKIGFLYSDSWDNNSIAAWVKIKNNTVIKDLNSKITDLVYKHREIEDSKKPNNEELKKKAEDRTEFMVMPFSDIRLFGHYGYGQNYGTMQSIYILSGLAIFILLIACINFINLSTARSVSRAKEVGIRKVVGAVKNNLFVQFFGESLSLTIIALIFSLIIFILLLPLFNDITGKSFPVGSLLNLNFLMGILMIVILTGIISGSYPALYLSLFEPLKVLKGTIKTSSKSGFFRKFLVVMQFSLAIILLIGTTVIYKQIEFMRNKNLGYDKEQLLYIPLRGDTKKNYAVLKEELKKNPKILNVSGTSQRPTNFGSNSSNAKWDGKNPNFEPLIGMAWVDFDYVQTLKIEMDEGRPFSDSFSTDTINSVLINEEVRKLMGAQNAVGKRFNFAGVDGIIVGVMKNYHYWAVQENIEPLALYASSRNVNFAIVRVIAGDVPGSLENIKSIWQKIFPSYPFEYRFFDEDFDSTFRSDERLGTLIKYAACLAILIACLGLFGLASFMAEQRTKEIGIRKVLGATVSGITMMLSKEFIQWVIIANLIGGPAAYFLSKQLLQNYAYRISISWWIFGLAILTTLFIAFLTVGWKTIQAARANPAKCIKYE